MTFWLVAGLAAFVVGLSKGGLPAVSVLAVPLLSLMIDPVLATGLLLPIFLIADGYALYLFRKAFSPRNLIILLPAGLVGVVTGFLMVSHIPSDAVKLLLAIIGLSYLANALHARLRKGDVPARPADWPRGLFWGSLAGFTSYIAHSGAPPYQAYVLPQKLEKMTYLGTTTMVFAALNLMKLPAFILAGQISWESSAQSAWLAPFALAGAWSGAQISRWLSQRVFFLLVEVALGLVSLRLLYEVFF